MPTRTFSGPNKSVLTANMPAGPFFGSKNQELLLDMPAGAFWGAQQMKKRGRVKKGWWGGDGGLRVNTEALTKVINGQAPIGLNT